MKGYIALHRQLLESWIAEDPMALALWARILLEAAHKDVTRPYKGIIYDLKKGDLFFGLEHWSLKTGITREVIRNRIKLFEKQGMITYKKHPKISIISVVNWSNFQKYNILTTESQQADNRLTTGSQHKINNVNNVDNVNNKEKCLSSSQAKRDQYDWQMVLQEWNKFAEANDLSRMNLVGDKRKKVIKDSFQLANKLQKQSGGDQLSFEEFVNKYLAMADSAITPFHKGQQEGSNWKADFNYIFAKDVTESLLTQRELRR